MKTALTKSSFFYRTKASKYGAVLLGLWAGFAFMGVANAAQTGQVTITCAKPDGTERTFTVGWDNSNQFFADKGDIAHLFCEGGHAGEYTVFVSTTVSDLSLRYYQGVVPQMDTPTTIVETHTPQVVESSTPVSETQTSSDTTTSTVVVAEPSSPSSPVETPTVDSPNQSSDSSSVVVETSTPVLDETQTSTSESSTQTIPVETSTPVVETPLPTPPPVVEPQPVPVVAAPQPEPQPQPVPVPQPETLPEPLPEVTDTEAPLEEQPLEEQPVVEEQLPVEEPSERPVEEETNETPVEEPEILEPTSPTPEPSPLPSAEPAPVIQPDTAYVPPSNDGATVTLDNGVVITEEEAAAIVLLSNPAELISELFSDPGAVLSALGSVGADMSPEVREKSEKVVLASVIAGNIATQAAATAGAVAAYRRKP